MVFRPFLANSDRHRPIPEPHQMGHKPMKSLRFTPEETVTREEESNYVVLGGGPIGSSIARRLHADNYTVHLVDESKKSADIPGFRGDPAKIRDLEEADLSPGSTVIVSTPSDRRNLLIAQLVRANFDVDRIVVLTNDPEKLDLFESAGHEPVCATTAISSAMAESI